jgi:PKD repeat protein
MVVKRSFLSALLLASCLWGVSYVALAEATVDFSWIPASPAVEAQVTFTAEVEGDPTWFVLFEWDFDNDGQYDDGLGRVQTYSFAAVGTYHVTLKARDDRGASHYVAKDIIVTNRAPTACFTFTPAYPSAGELVLFDGACSTDVDGTITTYTWAFSDGTSATGRTVSHAFTCANPPSPAWATLTVCDNGRACDSVRRTVPVQPISPVADFTWTPASPTTQDIVRFEDLSVDRDCGTLVSWEWSFGDGSTSMQRNPTHQYVSGGLYDVTLVVRCVHGMTAAIVKTIRIAGPAAAFAYSPLNPTTQDPVQFVDRSTSVADDIVSWSWNFGDSTHSSAQNPTHTFADHRTYRVRLTISTEHGAISSAERDLIIRNAPPTATFSFTPASPKLGQAVTFSAAGSGDPDGTVVMYEWDFDADGTTDSTGASVVHSFDEVRGHPVTLTVTDDDGAKGAVTRVVPVQAAPPTASFTFTPATPYTGQVVTFNASGSTDSDGTIILYEWDFNADGVSDATGTSTTRSFASPGVYPVTLTVTDNDLAVDVTTRGVPVSVGGTSGDNQAPIADFTFAPLTGDTIRINQVVTFRADGSSDADGTIVAYEWDFDRDGHFDATGKVITNVFLTGGAQIVQLRVTDDDGTYGYKTRVVSVEFVRPRAEFSYSPTEPEVGDVVSLDGSASTDPDGTIQFYEWDFDNDARTDATGKTVNHVFPRGGSMPVTLVVTDDDGVKDSVTRSVQVKSNNPPVAEFTYSPTSPTTADTIVFSSTSTDTDGGIIAWLWTFGDPDSSTNTSTAQTPSHQYSVAKSYTVKLTITDTDGATAERSRAVVVTAGQPRTLAAQFTWVPTSAEPGDDVTFTPTLTNPSPVPTGLTISYAWNFGDGTTSTERVPTHAFAEEGGYTVTLTVSAAGWLPGTRSYLVRVGPQLYLDAYPNPATGAAGATFRFALPSGATDPVLRVYKIDGPQVLEETLDGRQTYHWDLTDTAGDRLGNGLYFCFLTASDSDGRTIRSSVFRLLIVR